MHARGEKNCHIFGKRILILRSSEHGTYVKVDAHNSITACYCYGLPENKIILLISSRDSE